MRNHRTEHLGQLHPMSLYYNKSSANENFVEVAQGCDRGDVVQPGYQSVQVLDGIQARIYGDKSGKGGWEEPLVHHGVESHCELAITWRLIG